MRQTTVITTCDFCDCTLDAPNARIIPISADGWSQELDACPECLQVKTLVEVFACGHQKVFREEPPAEPPAEPPPAEEPPAEPPA